MKPIINALTEVGPSRTERLVEILTQSGSMSAEAARQRLSNLVLSEIVKSPISVCVSSQSPTF